MQNKALSSFFFTPLFKWLLGGVFLLLILIIWSPWSNSIYDKYNYSKVMPAIGFGALQQANLKKASDLFNNRSYSEARKILQREYMGNPQNATITYFFAITLIEAGQEYEARTLFLHLNRGNSLFKTDAGFYVALSFVHEDKYEEAIDWLKRIPKGDPQYQRAKNLMADLI